MHWTGGKCFGRKYLSKGHFRHFVRLCAGVIPQPYKTVSGWREGKRLVFGGFWEVGGGRLHRNYTGWEELQYDKKLKIK